MKGRKNVRMNQLLFISTCMRGPEHSRTDGLCRTFLKVWKQHNPDGEIRERDLTSADLPVMTAQLSQKRDAAVEEKNWNAPLLEAAREVAEADLVVIGAPYWDLSCPAALKVYLEWASTLGVTFRYDEQGQLVGMSKAEKLLYITTGGGVIQGQNYGFDYVKALGAMLGISNAQCVMAELLDVQGGPGEENLAVARRELEELAKHW